MTPSLKLAIYSTPSLLDCVEEVKEKYTTQGALANLVRTLDGESKIVFEALMSQLGEANGHIDEFEERVPLNPYILIFVYSVTRKNIRKKG